MPEWRNDETLREGRSSILPKGTPSVKRTISLFSVFVLATLVAVTPTMVACECAKHADNLTGID